MPRIKNILVKHKGKNFFIKAERIKGQIWFHLKGQIFVLSSKTAPKKAKGSFPLEEIKNTNILSPMPGKIVQIPVAAGGAVEEGQTLLILSSMKMEYTVKSPGKGVVRSLNVRQGDKVSSDQKLMELSYT